MSVLSDINALTLLQGTTFRAAFYVQSTGATPVPVSLNGYGASFTIYSRAGGSVLYTFNDQTTVDPVSNQPFASGDAPVQVEPHSTTGLIQVRVGANITALVPRTCAYETTVYLHSDPTEIQLVAAGPLLVLPVGADITELSNYV